MRYEPDWHVGELTAVHRSFITPLAIAKRPPLSADARRAGWIGCNIMLGSIPVEGIIPLIQAGTLTDLPRARQRFQRAERFSGLAPSARGWTAAVLTRLHRLNKPTFTLQDAYGLEGELSLLFPRNRHIRPKIRQQLQTLRDMEMIRFDGGGTYTLLP